ncbi:uncharacterized protein FIBRA_06465 [Fibroporia radiculosa]|uniref:ATP-dependent RNA helicase n=1 Tax=Fibroporia radiculosa TaxID=599839 RepID=J4H433_9APHY|nr:uncharacterized protein FIBRA_06465 [Fibroporia radiculosa]CCM04294.1 predicted protein [Fibroporia radiculosa]
MSNGASDIRLSTTQPKEKTKAKKRYLKAKKERRKKRKTTVEISDGPHAKQNQSRLVEEDVEESEEPQSAGSGEERDVAETISTRAQRERRPRKRRKLSTPVDDEDVAHTAPAPHADEIPEVISEDGGDEVGSEPPAIPVEAETVSAVHPATLPSFPLPTRPDAPSRSTLALQGLDKALVEAEIIDSALLQSFPSSGDSHGLSEKTKKRLLELGISELFAVQTAVVPFLLTPKSLKSLYLPYNPPRDLCVSAPTGSGKTLAYVLPIVEILSTRIVVRLRALVVLPTRDLVTQVRETFEAIGRGRGLKIGTATGQHSFTHEQAQLVADRSSQSVSLFETRTGSQLMHLRFLVIDEADRLLAQSFQDWLAQVLAATRPPANPEDLTESRTLADNSMARRTIPRADALAPNYLHLLHDVPRVRTDIDEKRESSCQKLLFSATLTRDPSKIVALNLHDPKYFVVRGRADGTAADTEEADLMSLVMEKFTMPSSLSEHMIVCDSASKPLMLFQLVHGHGVTNALVFTKSAESTTRLMRLFEFFEGAYSGGPDPSGSIPKSIVTKAYSSDLSPGERKLILDKFKNQEIHILICSDLISRGIDISHVSHVVSYDAPIDMRKYVHRVGRTARAGRAGDAWTLVEEQEVPIWLGFSGLKVDQISLQARHFKSMMKDAAHLEKVKRMRISEKDVAPLRSAYEVALGKLKDVYAHSGGS